MSGNEGFEASKKALTTAANAFDTQAGVIAKIPVNTVTEALFANPAPGDPYAAQQTQYGSTLTTLVEDLAKWSATATKDLAQNLTRAGEGYALVDSLTADNLTKSGSGS